MEKTVINLQEDGIYSVKNGELRKITTPITGFGKQIITWQDKKISHCEISFTEK